ncbi:unnamed protein product [Schistosoma rodhaini]|uniref:PTHB1 N-terminal domain-containing protein n=1 Tax=Schistosoma rodhaini TaxID=6188 RepID=A0AA85F2Y3_9TREM|nr:unnamed protein product [Schistosoma rodhaini]
MSLFKICDIWSSQLHTTNFEDGFCLKLSPLHNLHKSQYFILFGTSSGILSIFLPRAAEISDNEKSNGQLHDYNDLCLEYNTEHPILCIDCGNLVMEMSQYQQIAVLHSRMISVYNFAKSDDSFQGCSDNFSLESWKLTLSFKLNVQKDSYTLLLGKFFEKIQTDVICVQSVDASLYFFNANGELFQITLPNILIPGPIIFVKSIHSLIIATSIKLYCFSFLSSNIEHSQILYANHKNIPFDWSIVSGEPILCIDEIDSESATSKHYPLSYVVALGRKRIFLISETGSLLFTRRIDIPSKQLCVYGYSERNVNSPENLSFTNTQSQVSWVPRFLVTTEKNQLLVFKGAQLLWSALLSFGAIHISMPIFTMELSNHYGKTLPFIGLNFPSGLIVVLHRNGRITLSYLGTDPSNLVVPNIMKSSQNGHNYSNEIDPNQSQLKNESFDEEMHQVNERIDQLIKVRSSLLFSNNNHKNTHLEKDSLPKLKTSIRLNSNRLNTDENELCYIDIDIEFPKAYPKKQFNPVYLLTHSCPPIIIKPNYIDISSNELNSSDFVLVNHNNSYKYSYTLTCYNVNKFIDGENETSSIMHNQLPLDMNVVLMLYYTFTPLNYKNNNNNSNENINCPTDNSMSFNSRSITKCVTHCIQLPIILFASSTFVHKNQMIGKFSLVFQLITKFHNHLKNVYLSDLFPNFLPKNDTTGFNESSQNNFTLYVSFNGLKQISNADQQCVYISVKYNKKFKFKLQSNHPETFWPILQELIFHNNLVGKRKPNSDANNLYIILYTKDARKFMDDRPVPPKSPSSSKFDNYTSQLETLFNKLYESLDNHVNKRLELDNQISKLTVQARHYRAVQREVVDRIKSSQPNCLNGFNELLERDMNNLMTTCDLLDLLTQEYFQSGYSVISLVILLSFICLFCMQSSSSSSPSSFDFSEFESECMLFKPTHLLTMLHSTLSLENIQSSEFPESILSTESDEHNLHHVDFKQYLQAEINYFSEIIQSNHIEPNEKRDSFTNYQDPLKNYNRLLTPKYIYEQFYQLCKQFMSCDHKEIKRVISLLNR